MVTFELVPQNRPGNSQLWKRAPPRHGSIQNQRQTFGAPERRRRLPRRSYHLRRTRRNDGSRLPDILHHRSLFKIPVDTGAPVANIPRCPARSANQSLTTSPQEHAHPQAPARSLTSHQPPASPAPAIAGRRRLAIPATPARSSPPAPPPAPSHPPPAHRWPHDSPAWK